MPEIRGTLQTALDVEDVARVVTFRGNAVGLAPVSALTAPPAGRSRTAG